mgnify:FL=1
MTQKKSKKSKKSTESTKSKKSKKLSTATSHNIVDIPLSKISNKGSGASHGGVDYHYQNYSNILEFFKNLAFKKLCLFENPYIHLDVNDIKTGVFVLYDDSILIKNVKECMKSSNIFIPVIFNLITSEDNHANILLINKENKTIEVYEPHGSRTSSSTLGGVPGAYRKKIKSLSRFWNKIIPGYRVVNSVDHQQGSAFQTTIDPDNHSGFCVTWSILFVHYRILNSTVPLPLLVKYIAQKITTRKLLQYAKYVEDNIKNK